MGVVNDLDVLLELPIYLGHFVLRLLKHLRCLVYDLLGFVLLCGLPDGFVHVVVEALSIVDPKQFVQFALVYLFSHVSRPSIFVFFVACLAIPNLLNDGVLLAFEELGVGLRDLL